MGGRNVPNYNTEVTTDIVEHTIEHNFWFEADEPVDFDWHGTARAYEVELYINGENAKHFILSQISEEGIKKGHYTIKAMLKGDIYNVCKEGMLESTFLLGISGSYSDYFLNKIKNTLTYTLEEKIDGKTIKRDSKTVVLDYENSSTTEHLISNIKL